VTQKNRAPGVQYQKSTFFESLCIQALLVPWQLMQKSRFNSNNMLYFLKWSWLECCFVLTINSAAPSARDPSNTL